MKNCLNGVGERAGVIESATDIIFSCISVLISNYVSAVPIWKNVYTPTFDHQSGAIALILRVRAFSYETII